jgi:uncharacterized membrane protein affecting hemolysin expression
MGSNPILLWDILGQQFPSICQLDLLTLQLARQLANATEPLAVENDSSPDLNALGDDIIEALKYLKA